MRNKLIVLIDNDVEDLDLLETNIKGVDPDCSCISFIFSEHAISVIGNELKTSPDYIFIDVNMSRVTGPECLFELRKMDQLQHCRIVMFSGVMPFAVGESFKALGAFDCFQKPLVGSEYRKTLLNIFNKTEPVVLHPDRVHFNSSIVSMK